LKHYAGLLLVVLFLCNGTVTADTQTDEEKATASAQKIIKASVSVDTGLVTGGSGFYISPNIVITNEHVIRDTPNDTITIRKKSGYTCTGTVGYREEKLDLAIIHSSCTSDTVLSLNTNVEEGQTVLAYGSPQGFPFTLSKGIVSSFRWDMIQFDAKVTFGSSGGVLANLNGEVIGVVSKGAKDNNYIGFAIPASEVKKFYERSIE
jgi:S1-C subfamily serine protease